MEKKRLVISYKNLSAEAKSELKELYPEGYENHVFKVDLGPKSFYAVRLETEQASYLVKVDVENISRTSYDDEDEEEENDSDISFEEKIGNSSKDLFVTEDDDEEEEEEEDEEDEDGDEEVE